jgi:RNA polymerase sigma-70 factor, ECF subfamily
MEHEAGQITQLLQRWKDGSIEAEKDLIALVLPELHRLARYYLRGERKGISLQSGDLVNEIYIQLIAARDRDWQNRQHFFRLAARAMRNYLIGRIRRRPGVQFLALDEVKHVLQAEGCELELGLAVDSLLDELDKHDPELCTIVELKFFLGLTDEEAAETLRLTLRTFQRRWQDARRWLFERLEANDVEKRRQSLNGAGRTDSGQA